MSSPPALGDKDINDVAIGHVGGAERGVVSGEFHLPLDRQKIVSSIPGGWNKTVFDQVIDCFPNGHGLIKLVDGQCLFGHRISKRYPYHCAFSLLSELETSMLSFPVRMNTAKASSFCPYNAACGGMPSSYRLR